MKGLLIKDYYLLLQQKTFFFLIICMVISCGIAGENSTFAISFIMFVFSLLSCNTISYDEYNHGYTFLFTLPVTKKLYVKEKYILSILTCFIGWITACLMALLTMFVQNTLSGFPEALSFSLFLLPALFLLQCIDIPIQLKFGSENGRNIRFLLTGGIILAVILLAKLPVFSSITTLHLSQLTVSPVLCTGIIILLVLLSITISYTLSSHIMDKKEF